jgi:hypothetical protein
MTRALGVERRHRLCRPSIITRDATVCVDHPTDVAHGLHGRILSPNCAIKLLLRTISAHVHEGQGDGEPSECAARKAPHPLRRC